MTEFMDTDKNRQALCLQQEVIDIHFRQHRLRDWQPCAGGGHHHSRAPHLVRIGCCSVASIRQVPYVCWKLGNDAQIPWIAERSTRNELINSVTYITILMSDDINNCDFQLSWDCKCSQLLLELEQVIPVVERSGQAFSIQPSQLSAPLGWKVEIASNFLIWHLFYRHRTTSSTETIEIAQILTRSFKTTIVRFKVATFPHCDQTQYCTITPIEDRMDDRRYVLHWETFHVQQIWWWRYRILLKCSTFLAQFLLLTPIVHSEYKFRLIRVSGMKWWKLWCGSVFLILLSSKLLSMWR